MTTYAITHCCLALIGSSVLVRCQVVYRDRSRYGGAKAFTMNEAADMVDHGDVVEFWHRVGTIRVLGGTELVGREANGKLLPVEHGTGDRLLRDLPAF